MPQLTDLQFDAIQSYCPEAPSLKLQDAQYYCHLLYTVRVMSNDTEVPHHQHTNKIYSACVGRMFMNNTDIYWIFCFTTSKGKCTRAFLRVVQI